MVLDFCSCDGFDFGLCLSLGIGLDHNYIPLFCFGFCLTCRLAKYNKENLAWPEKYLNGSRKSLYVYIGFLFQFS